MSEIMHSKKPEKAELENMLSEYFRTRSFFPYEEITSNHSPTIQNHLVHQKYNKRQSSVFEFKKFCFMTGLHGFFYFVENNLNKMGKFFWAVCLAAIYVLCCVMVYMLILMFWKMPAIISLDNAVSSVYTIPFPAVTVCSANRVRPSVHNHLDINSTDYKYQLIQNTIHSICENNPVQKKLKFSEEFLDGSFVSEVLKNLSFPCGETVKLFQWLNSPEKDPCNIWFQETFTSYGLCYSFNMMPMRDLLTGVDEWSQDHSYGWKHYPSSWQPDTGYNNDAPITHLPLRTLGDNTYHSVTMVLDLHTEDFNKECSQGMEIFYILIHSPAEWPDRSHPTLLTATNTLKTISVKPIVLTTSQELMSWGSATRHCYFQNERKLKFFKVYTKKNCMLECQSSQVLEQCGCVPFYYLRIKNTAICGPAKMSCWVTAFQALSCDCLPDCTEVRFKVSSMVAQYNKSAHMSNSSKSMSGSALISVFYQSKNFIGLNRIMTFTFGQFMGNVGGIMGLCLGFSLLSLAEIIYFLTLRPLINYCNIKRKMKKIDPTRTLKNKTEFTTNGEYRYYK